MTEIVRPVEDPDLDLPSITGRAFQDGTSTAVRTIGRDHNISLSFQGDVAATNGTNVILPEVDPIAQLTRRQVGVGRGYADHETLHKLLTDMGPECQERLAALREDEKHYTLALSNAIEDMRIENGGKILYPGMPASIDATASQVGKQFVDEHYEENPDIVNDRDMMLPIAITWAGRKALGYKGEWNEACLSLLPDETRKRAEQVADLALQLPTGALDVASIDKKVAYEGTKQAIDLAELIAFEEAQRREEEEPPPPPGQPEGPCNDGPAGDAPTGAGGESGECPVGSGSGGEEEGEVPASEVAAGQDDSDGGSEPLTEQGGHGAITEAIKPPEPRPFSGELSQAMEVFEKTGEYEGDDERHRVPFRDCDLLITRDGVTQMNGNPAPRYCKREWDGVMRESLNEGIKRYRQAIKRTGPAIGTMKRKLQRALVARADDDWEGGYRSGRLDVRRRGREIVLARDKVYRRKVEADKVDTAVTLLIDLSGSMMGSKVAIAESAAIALAESIGGYGVAIEVLGFLTAENMWRICRNGDGPMSMDQFDAMGGGFGRLDTTHLYVFKSFKDTMQSARASMGLIAAMANGANADGDSLLQAYDRLRVRDEERKIIMVLSDGHPATSDSMHGRYQDRFLRRVVRYVTDCGVDTVGIGIADEAVKQFYPRYVVLNDIDELGKTVIDQLARMLLGENFRVDNADLLDARRQSHTDMRSAMRFLGWDWKSHSRRWGRKTPYPIPAEWFALMPGMPRRFWVKVYKQVVKKRLGVRNFDAVQEIARELFEKEKQSWLRRIS